MSYMKTNPFQEYYKDLNSNGKVLNPLRDFTEYL